MKFTSTLLAASAAAIALTTGTEARLRGSHGRQFDFYGGSKTPYQFYGLLGSRTAYSYGGTNYNSGGYKADPTRSAMDAARRAGALTNTEDQRMRYSSNFRDDDDSLGDCNDDDWYLHSGSRGCRSLFVKNDGSYGDEDDDLGAMVDRPSDWRDEDDVLGWNP
eukprot:Stramenopile-MAST_4_protein_5467